MTHKLIDGELLLTQIFWAGDDGGNASVCIYCSWREIQPSLIYISQQNPVHGGIVDVRSEFFDLVHSLENADVSASSDEITEVFDTTPTISYHRSPLYALAHTALVVDATSSPEVDPNKIPKDDL